MQNSRLLQHSSIKVDAPRAATPSVADDIVEMVVVTTDQAFLRTLRNALSGSRRLWHVASADKVGDLLIAGQVGILVVDVMALHEPAGGFLSQIKRQFPDLVMMVAGKRKAEISLALLIRSGAVYRFIHKPLSPARAKAFADAAVNKYAEQRLRQANQPVPAAVAPPRRGLWLGAAAGALLLLGVAGWALVHGLQNSSPPPEADAPGTPASESPLLARAAAALAANRLTQPSGDNALQMYQRLLAQNPADPVARAGVAEVRERLAMRAENALVEERLDEAGAAIDTARRAGVDGARIAFLSAELAQARGRLKGTIAERRKGDAPAPADGTATDSTPVERGAPVGAAVGGDPAAPSLAAASPAAPSPAAAPGATANLENSRPAQIAAAASSDSAAIPAAVRHDVDPAAETRRFLSDVISARQLTLLKSVEPLYPRKAEEDRTEGWVDLDFTVATDGTVRDIDVRGATPAGTFESAAVAALAQWRYRPALHNGVPAAQRARIRVRFAMPG